MKNIVGRRDFVLRILERADMGGFGVAKLAPALQKGRVRACRVGWGSLGSATWVPRLRLRKRACKPRSKGNRFTFA